MRKDLSVFREDKDEKKEDPKEKDHKEKEKDSKEKTEKKKIKEKEEKKEKHEKHVDRATQPEEGPAPDESDEVLNPEFFELFTRAAPLSIEGRKSLVLPIISNEEADIWLEEQQDGSSFLRLDEAALPSRISPLILSYKYHNLAFHYRFEEKVTGGIKIKEKDKGTSTSAQFL